MKALAHLGDQPVSVPLVADDVLELHAGRLLLLLSICGIKQEITGLTKLAKLDFFVRYPGFFKRIAKHINKAVELPTSSLESPMVRHHYGPWDRRYYHLLPYLESRGLIAVTKEGKAFRFQLTASGKERATALRKLPQFRELVDRMGSVKKVLGRMSGNTLKQLIYEVFDDEVTRKQLGEVIG